MKTVIAFSPFIVYVILLVILLVHKAIVGLRYADLPSAVTRAIEARFPDTSKLAVTRNESASTFQIELTDYCHEYVVEVRQNGEIVHVECDALYDDPIEGESRAA